jgi:CRISPR system Cascade subunit CasE
MNELYLSRVTLRPDPSVMALATALIPTDDTDMNTDHRAVWSLFADAAKERDFLWRKKEGRGRYMILSRRVPDVDSPIFEVETRSFDPVLAEGDELVFQLRVNATVSRRNGPGRGQRHDVAMDLLRAHPRETRAEHRNILAERAARSWLESHADGFELKGILLERYHVALVPRQGSRSARFGVFDLAGRICVTDPVAFLNRVAAGFGRARAFGCGLMLIRRA